MREAREKHNEANIPNLSTYNKGTPMPTKNATRNGILNSDFNKNFITNDIVSIELINVNLGE